MESSTSQCCGNCEHAHAKKDGSLICTSWKTDPEKCEVGFGDGRKCREWERL